MAVRKPFILSLYGVLGVLIEYYAHNCRYFDFRPSDTLILANFQPNRIKYKVTRNLGNLKNVTFLFYFFKWNILGPNFSLILPIKFCTFFVKTQKKKANFLREEVRKHQNCRNLIFYEISYYFTPLERKIRSISIKSGIQ